MKVQPLGTEATANGSSNASNFGESSAVRVVNTAASTVLITMTDSDGTSQGTMTLTNLETAVIHKPKNFKLFAASKNAKFTPVDVRG